MRGTATTRVGGDRLKVMRPIAAALLVIALTGAPAVAQQSTPTAPAPLGALAPGNRT